jgi:ureidoglycolate lyase
MSPQLRRIPAEPLTPESFAAFGDVLAPVGKRLDNRDLLSLGYARMSDPVSEDRLDDFDVLDYWGAIASITREPMRLGYLRTKRRPFAFSWFERHLKGTQTFIPLGGQASIFAVAPPSALADPKALPELAQVRAFRLDGAAGVNIRPGVWHWTPFPVGETADFIILVRENVAEDDLHFVDLEERMQARIAIEL